MPNQTARITIAILAIGFVFALGGEIWLLATGSAMAMPFFVVIVLMAWVSFHLVTSVLPQVMVERPDEEKEQAGVESCESSDVLLVQSAAPEQGSASAGWINTLNACVGPVTVAAPEALHDAAEGKKLVVIPSRESGLLSGDEKEAKRIEELAARGCAVVIDNPGPESAKTLGLRLAADTVNDTVTWVDSDILDQRISDTIQASPMLMNVRPPEVVPADFSVWMRVGEFPAVLTRAVGQGVIIVLLFDFAQLGKLLRQGCDKTDMGLALTGYKPFHRIPRHLRENDVPLADVFDAFLMGLVRQFVPLCGWWPHADAAASTLVVTANDDYAGMRTNVVFDVLEDAEVNPTLFLLPDSLTEKESKATTEKGAGAGLLWNRYNVHSYKGGLRKNPHRTLESQITAVNKALPQDTEIDITRIHHMRMDGGMEENFRLMQQHGMRADASFGPGPGQQGYVFATGFPFHPVAVSGAAFSLLELPFHVHDRSGAPGREWLNDLVSGAAELYHSPITIVLHPHNLLQNPRVRDAVRHLLDKAKEAGMSLTNAGAYLDFWQARAQSPVKSSFDGGKLTISVQAKTDGLSLLLPGKLRGCERVEIAIDGEKVSEEKVKNNLLPLEQGVHEIIVKFS